MDTTETRTEILRQLQTVWQTQGAKALVDAARTGGPLQRDGRDLWLLAMTACYGPVGIHESYYGTDGLLTAEALERLPDIACEMARASRKIDDYFSHEISAGMNTPSQ